MRIQGNTEIFAIEISEKELLAKIYNELLNLNHTKMYGLTQLKISKRPKQIAH